MAQRDAKKKRIIDTLSKCDDIHDAEQHYAALLKKREEFKSAKGISSFSTILGALGSEERLLLLDTLMEKDRCVCELEAIMDKAQASVSHHLRILEAAGLIKGWKKGKFTHYSLVKSQFQRFHEFYTSWLNNAINWFGETGHST